MTAILDPTVRRTMLAERLAALTAQRDQLQLEIAPQTVGDDADRATNVDAHVRLAVLNERITAIEVELANGPVRRARAESDAVDVGDVVTVDFGDGPEEYLLGSVDEAAEGVDVITPGSPLGQALLGATVGATVEYRTGQRTLRAQVLAAA
jgi:transcription elongation factor GreA